MTSDPEAYEIVDHPFPAMYSQRCTVDRDHVIKRGDTVAKVQRADNPMLPVGGVACTRCIRMMQRV